MITINLRKIICVFFALLIISHLFLVRPKSVEATPQLGGVILALVAVAGVVIVIEGIKEWLFSDESDITYNCTAFHMGQIYNPSPEMRKACSKKETTILRSTTTASDETSRFTLFSEILEIKRDLQFLKVQLRNFQAKKVKD